MPPFAQSLRSIQILILEIFNPAVAGFLWLKSSRALILNELERFSTVSISDFGEYVFLFVCYRPIYLQVLLFLENELCLERANLDNVKFVQFG